MFRKKTLPWVSINESIPVMPSQSNEYHKPTLKDRSPPPDVISVILGKKPRGTNADDALPSDDFILLEQKNIPAEAIQENSNTQLKTTYFPLRLFINTMTLLFGSAIESLQFYASMKDISGDMLGFIPMEQATTVTIIILYVITSITVNRKYNNEGIEKIYRIWQGEKLPGWEELPEKKAYFANLISFFTNGWAFLSDAAGVAYSLEQQGPIHNRIVNFLIGVLASLTNIPTEGYETHIFIRTLFAKTKATNEAIEEENIPVEPEPAHCVPMLLLSYMLKFFGALEDVIESYTTFAAVSELILGITSPYLRFPVLILSLTNGLNDLMFNGKNTDDALRKLKAAITDGKIGAKEVGVFLVSLFASGMISYAQLSLTLSLLRDPDATFPSPLPEQLPEIIALIQAWGAGSREFVNSTYYLYPALEELLNGTVYVTQKLKHLICGPVQKEEVYDAVFIEEPGEDLIQVLPANETKKAAEIGIQDDDWEKVGSSIPEAASGNPASIPVLPTANAVMGYLKNHIFSKNSEATAKLLPAIVPPDLMEIPKNKVIQN